MTDVKPKLKAKLKAELRQSGLCSRKSHNPQLLKLAWKLRSTSTACSTLHRQTIQAVQIRRVGCAVTNRGLECKGKALTFSTCPSPPLHLPEWPEPSRTGMSRGT